jgi:nickel-type superoxide dismutase maturation protease
MKWPLGLYRVVGDSMRPTYKPGDTLLGLRWFTPKPGQIVVAQTGIPLIKRIIRFDGNQIWIEGDNRSASTDSRHFGPIAPDKLEAKIIFKLG